MHKKLLKIPTIILNIAIFGMMAYWTYFSDKEIDFFAIYQNLGKFSISIFSVENWLTLLFLLGIPTAFIFTFTMRAIDNHSMFDKDGKIWIAGVVLSGVYSILMYYFLGGKSSILYNVLQADKGLSGAYSEILLFFFLVSAFIICMCGTFMVNDGKAYIPKEGESGDPEYLRYLDHVSEYKNINIDTTPEP